MSDRCEPPEHLRGVNGWHWLDSPGADDTGMPWPCRWVASAQGWWGWGLGGHAPQEAAEKGYRYLAPVTPPSTVAALVEALDGLLADTQHATHDCGDNDCPVRRARAALAAVAPAIDAAALERAAVACSELEVHSTSSRNPGIKRKIKVGPAVAAIIRALKETT